MSAEDPIQIRSATIDDRASALALIQQFVSRGKILPRTLDELEHVLANGYVAVQEDRVVGFVTLEIYSQKLAEIRSLVVDDSLQGRGIGRRLVETCVNRARQRGVFEVMAVSSSEDFFRNCGFDFTLPGEKKAFFLQTRPQHE
jgi:amino-acid N-acetyltransferase